VVAFGLTTETPSLAQGANAPVVQQPTSSAVSQPLWAAPQSPGRGAAPQGPHTVPLHPLPQHGVPGGEHANDRALQNKAGEHLHGEQNPLFGGIVQDGYIPSDANIAVGPNHIVQVVNSEIAVFTKSGTMELGYPKILGSLWTTLGGDCAANNAGDPIVQYDRLADRWLVSQLGSVTGPSFSECFAVSQTSDPTGAYNTYSYSFGRNLNDYPKFGVWPTASNSAYLATYNLFADGASFVGADLCAYDRQAMLAGAASPVQICYMVPDGGYLPSDLDGTSPPSAGEPGFFLNFSSLSRLGLYKLVPNFAIPSSSTFTGPTGLAVTPFQEACGGGTCIPQPGTNEQLDSLGDRLMYRLAYRKFSDHEAMVVNHSVNTGSSVGVRWYELDATSPGAFSVAQHGTFAPDSSYRWMGSMAMDQAGDIALGYSRSSDSPGDYPSVYLTGRVPSDPPGTMEAETALHAGSGSQTSYSRWGDYSALRIDPSDDCTFWYTNEYYPQTAPYNWFTYIGSFKFSSCGSPNPDFSVSESPSPITLAAGASNSGSPATVKVTSLSGFSSAVSLSTNCSAPLTCTLNPGSVTPPSGSSTTSSLTVSVAAGASPGTYTNTITGQSGNLTHTTSFSVTVPTPPDFTVSESPSPIALAAGTSNSGSPAIVTVTSLNGFNSAVTLSATTCAAPLTCTLNPGSVTPPTGSSATSNLTVSVAAGAASGTYPGTVTGTSGNLTHSTNFSVTVPTPTDFSLSESPSPITLAAGTSNSGSPAKVTVTSLNGFNSAVTLSATTCAAPLTCTLNPGSVTPPSGSSATSNLTVSVAAGAASGTYPGTVAGTSGNLTHSTNFSVSVPAPGSDFSISAASPSLTISLGTEDSDTINLTASGGSSSVSLSISGLPAWTSASFYPNPAASTGSSTLTIRVSRFAQAGTYPLTVTGKNSSNSHSTNISLTIQ
jgi:hypothetical protein